MTHQFGDAVVGRARNASLSDAELLRRAKRALDAMAFVGFYEDLARDFWRLRQEIFADVVDVPYVHPFAFWLGAWLSTPRTRVRKFAAREDRDSRAYQRMLAAQQLDYELYNYAVQRFKPTLRLYDSYFAFACANALPIIVGAAAALALALALRKAWQWYEWKRRRTTNVINVKRL